MSNEHRQTDRQHKGCLSSFALISMRRGAREGGLRCPRMQDAIPADVTYTLKRIRTYHALRTPRRSGRTHMYV